MSDVPVIGIVGDPCQWHTERPGSPCDVLDQVLAGLREFGIPAIVCSNRSRDEIEPPRAADSARWPFSADAEREMVAGLMATRSVSGIRAAYGGSPADQPILIGIGAASDDVWLLNQVDIPFVIRSVSQAPPPREFASAWVAVEDLPDGLRAALGEALDELSRDVVSAG